jgi:hypothetical protein
LTTRARLAPPQKTAAKNEAAKEVARQKVAASQGKLERENEGADVSHR